MIILRKLNNGACSIVHIIVRSSSVVEMRLVEMRGMREIIWHPDASISSGIYLIRATMKDGTTMTKLIVYFIARNVRAL